MSIRALFRPGWIEMAQKRQSVSSEMFGTLGVKDFRYSRSLDYLFITNGGILDERTQVKTHSVTVAHSLAAVSALSAPVVLFRHEGRCDTFYL